MSMAATCLMLLTLALRASLIIPLVYGADNDSDKQALVAFKKSLTDPDNALQSWDGSGNPCNWTNIYCKNNRVTTVVLGHTNLGGHLVPELGGLLALEYLSVFNNKIEGTIPAELGNLEKLQVLGLSENQLSGGIPPSLGNLKSLNLLLLDSNRLTGEVPSEIANLPNLNRANFSNNIDLCWNFWPTPTFVGNYTLCK
jgi:hypothetical protein